MVHLFPSLFRDFEEWLLNLPMPALQTVYFCWQSVSVLGIGKSIFTLGYFDTQTLNIPISIEVIDGHNKFILQCGLIYTWLGDWWTKHVCFYSHLHLTCKLFFFFLIFPPFLVSVVADSVPKKSCCPLSSALTPVSCEHWHLIIFKLQCLYRDILILNLD